MIWLICLGELGRKKRLGMGFNNNWGGWKGV